MIAGVYDQRGIPVSESKGLDAVPVEHIAQSILILRGQRVLLDTDLAELYEVSTKRLNQQVRRNLERFPSDFMFQLTEEELLALRLQNVTLKKGRGQHRKYRPYAFTEHGAIMAATILNSDRAVAVSVFVVRAFVKLREVLASNKELLQKFESLERKLETHDQTIVGILKQIRQLMNEPKRGVDGV